MKFISAKCPNCGAELQVAENLKSGFCNHCGSKILFEPEVSNVKIDQKKSLDNYRELAKSALRGGEGKNALKYAEKALEINAHDSEMWYVKTRALSEYERPHSINSDAIIECGNNAISYAEEEDEDNMRQAVYISYLWGAARLLSNENKKPVSPGQKENSREICIHISIEDAVDESREENAIKLAKAVPKEPLSENVRLTKEQFMQVLMEYTFKHYSLYSGRLNGFLMESYMEVSPLPTNESESLWRERVEMQKSRDKQHKAKLEREKMEENISDGCYWWFFIILVIFLFAVFKCAK